MPSRFFRDRYTIDRFPYECAFVQPFYLLCGRDVSEMLIQLPDLQEWLSDNVYENGICGYHWTDNDVVELLRDMPGSGSIKFARYILFTHQEDMLAFKLKFGL